MSKFSDDAIKLSRNPLGILALFLVLIYSIASLTFLFAKNLPDSLIVYFVIFILIYPLIILATFYRLVTQHHTKLYAPRDFINPGDFLECLYGDQRKILTFDQKAEQVPSVPTKKIRGDR